MAEHWCKEHQTVWFKKGKMKGYAHPIMDENGEPTSEWCNEPKSATDVGSKTPEPPRSGSTNDSIESQVAFKGMIELIVADKIQVNSPTGMATMTWAITRLEGKDVKTAKEVSDEKVEIEPTTTTVGDDDSGRDELISKITESAKGLGWTGKKTVDLIKQEFKLDLVGVKSVSQALNQLRKAQLELLLVIFTEAIPF